MSGTPEKTKSCLRKMFRLIAKIRFGGSVNADMNGKLLFIPGPKGPGVRYVQEKSYFLDSTISEQNTPSSLLTGILQKTEH